MYSNTLTAIVVNYYNYIQLYLQQTDTDKEVQNSIAAKKI